MPRGFPRINTTICAVATPPGQGAIAIVRISGPDVPELAAKHFRSKDPLRERYAAYGEILDERGMQIDKGLAILSLAPHSYTGEHTLELHVHGSPVIVREVLRALIATGVSPAGPGEFTQRAFLNGKMDLHAAESVADIIAAESRSSARAALANLSGGLASEIRAQRKRLAGILEELAAAIDFPDEVAEPAREVLAEGLVAIEKHLDGLRREGERGRIVREGVSVAIVGPPNAGKSSLLNALLGEARAIVSEIPGTTRDTIEERVIIDGVLVRIIDTAGIRSHAEQLESEGISRTRKALSQARIAILVFDGSVPVEAEARAILEETRELERIVLANKSDLGDNGVDDLRRLSEENIIQGSAFEASTLEAIRREIAQHGWNGTLPDLERPHLASAREFEAAGEAVHALALARGILERGEPVDLIASELQRAFIALGHITGDTATEELLTGIFARFCIGK